MASDSTVTINRGVLIAGAVVLVVTAAGGGWLMSQRSKSAIPAGEATQPSGPAPSAPIGEVAVTLSKESADRAGIEVTAVAPSSDAVTLRIPGTVQSNAYKTVSVT